MHSIHELFTECTDYIVALRQGKKGCFLVRSVYEDIDLKRFEHSIHERSPRNMPEPVHKAVNQHFLRIFKWPVRNGVFCFGLTNPTTDMQNLGYGRGHLIFPCDKFEYVCDSEIFDLYVHHYEFYTMYPEALTSEFIGSINYSNENLQYVMSQVSSYNRSVEIIINCQHYYLVNFKYINSLIDLIWE